MKSLFKYSLLFSISILSFLIRLTGIFKYEPILQEYDPYFNYKCLNHLVKHGLLSFIGWNDCTVWIPFGRKIFNTSYPGMMICTYILYCILNTILSVVSHLHVSPLTLCIYFPAICSIPTTFSMYMLCNTLFGSVSCSMLGSFLYAVCPAYISRSISGFYDYECFSMLLILLSFNFYVRLFCIKTEKNVYRCINKMHKEKNEVECGFEGKEKDKPTHGNDKEEQFDEIHSRLNYLTNIIKPYFNTFICFIIFYQILCFSWGGYTFVINLISLHSLSMIVLGFIYKGINRYTFKGEVSYKNVVEGVNDSTSDCKGDNIDSNKQRGVIKGTNKQHPINKIPNKQRGVSHKNNYLTLYNTLLFIDNPDEYFSINYWVFTSYFIVSTLTTYLIPFIGSKALFSQEHLFPLTVFIIHQIIKSFKLVKGKIIIFPVFLVGFLLVFAKKIFFLIQKLFLGRGRLLDLILRKKGTSALVNSVSEHSPRSFYGFFLDFHFLILIFPLSLKKYLNEHKIGVKSIFILLYSLVALFFSTRMLRLVLLLGPIVCITCSYYLIYLIKKCQNNISTMTDMTVNTGNRNNLFTVSSLFVIIYLLFLYSLHSIWITSNHYSVPYVILYNSRNEVMDDFRESWSFMKNNIKNENVLCWWDYGYQISVMGEVNTINDNNTCRGERIALTGKIFLSEEKEANFLCKKEKIKYIYCVVGVSNGYTSDDLNKIGWIKKIVSETFGESYLRINRESEEYKNILLYKMSYYRMENVVKNTWDYVRKTRFDGCEIKYFRNIFNSENYLIRIYEVL